MDIRELDWCDTWRWNFPVSSTLQEPDLRPLVPASSCGPEIAKGDQQRLLHQASSNSSALAHKAAAAQVGSPLIPLLSASRYLVRVGQGVVALQNFATERLPGAVRVGDRDCSRDSGQRGPGGGGAASEAPCCAFCISRRSSTAVTVLTPPAGKHTATESGPGST